MRPVPVPRGNPAVLKYVIAVLLGSLAISPGEAAMSDRTINGDPLDPRITSCGVIVTGSPIASIRPFIESSSNDVAGILRLSVAKTGSGGSSRTLQSGRFANGTLGTVQVAVNGPAHLTIEMLVQSDSGEDLCRLGKDVEI